MIGFSCLKRFVLFLVLCTALPAWSLPQPAYLRVPHWQRCVNTTTKGNAMFVCLPTKKPHACANSSWKSLTDRSLIPPCPASKGHE